MAQPTAHPKTGVYQFRKRVPSDIRAILGGPAEVKISLGTKDPKEAKRQFRVVEASCEDRWAMIRRGSQEFDDEQVEALGGEIYRNLIEKMGKNRGFWVGHSYSGLRAAGEMIDLARERGERDEWLPRLESAYGHMLDGVLGDRGMSVSDGTRVRLLLAAHRASKQAAELVLRQVEGDWSPDPAATRFPPIKTVSTVDSGVTLSVVWDEWAAETKPAYNTVRRWRPVLERLMSVAGHSDLRRISSRTSLPSSSNFERSPRATRKQPETSSEASTLPQQPSGSIDDTP